MTLLPVPMIHGLRARLLVLAWMVMLGCFALVPRAAMAQPTQGPGGPILVVTSSASTFGTYYAEILRNEGLNAFAVADIGTVSAATLANYDVVILAKMPLTGTQVTTLTNWVNGGGNLIAMAPDAQLAGLLGLTATGTSLAEAYLRIDTSAPPGNGLVGETMQFHGTADRYTLNGATAVATLYSNASTATSNPALSLRTAGSGRAAAFAFDLATSIVYTRQGNPAWATQERDGFAPIRSDDKFYGNAAGDPQPDWNDRSKVSIPQADEQQRLLANLIHHMNAQKRPLPRFWYLPFGKKAAVIMTGDDHGNNGTQPRFEQFKAASTPGCSVANWECIRGTSYIYPWTPLEPAQAAAYEAEGFEVGLHVNTFCSDFTASSLAQTYTDQIAEFTSRYSGVPAPTTQRHHCIVWSDWTSGATVQLANGIRLDTSYYYWPPSWNQDVPGFFNGTAMPMRFAGLDGALIDVYLATTQMTDESGQTYPYTVDTLLDGALGPEGYYGVYVVNAHTDVAASVEADTSVASAKARGIPVVTSRQMLTWLDGRNASSFSSIAYVANTLTFSITAGAGANGLQAMLPFRSGTNVLGTLTRGGLPVAYTVQMIKGVEYAFFAATAGAYSASYAADGTAPTVTSTSPAAGATGVSLSTSLTAIFSEAMDATSIGAGTFELRNAANALVAATVAYDAMTFTARLTPAAGLTPGETYTVTVRGGGSDPRVRDLAGNPLATNFSWSFTISAGPGCPCTIWPPSATPANPSENDAGPLEIGVKFRSELNGYITGVRFYKGEGNGGTHVGNLWTASGALLASAVFTNETSSGWQQVDFANPVPIVAGTTYVASYFAPQGRYAGDNNAFTAAGVDNPPLFALRDGVSGGNGVYAYGSSSTFPSGSWQGSNYWVDVVFVTNAGADTTPPSVTTFTPAAGATGVPTTSAVTATFNEAIDPTTIGVSTFELRDSTNALVSGSVNYSAGSLTATLTPGAPLAAGAPYTATIRGGATDPRIKDVAGNALSGNVNWTFTTALAGGGCPCSIWPAGTVPGVPSSGDTGAAELGVKFTSDVSGYVTGVRFYKGAGNTGTHIGNLWSIVGTNLASAVFVNESATGWQEVAFPNPVAITAGTVYVASYYAPNGNYAITNGQFASAGINAPPLRLLQNGVNGGNGVYAYGGASSFPSSSWNASNYWVDIVFVNNLGPDTTPPTVTASTPPNGTTGVPLTTSVVATFSEAVDAATVNASTVVLRAGSTVIPATVALNGATNTVTLTPTAPLSPSTLHTVTIEGGTADPHIKDLAGNALAADFTWSFTTGVVGGACAAPANPVVAENCLPGNPSSEWDISGAGHASIQGFATQISVNRGQTIAFKVDTDAAAYRFDIYRMGYYEGLGARKITTVLPSASLPQNQPSCLSEPASGLIDCGNWAVSGSWTVPANAVSGIYFAKLVRTDNGASSHIVFVVRDDASTSDLLFQTSDTTWQAYNSWGGNSLYTGAPAGRAYKVSYNRPFNTRIVDNGQDWVFNSEYPMVRWLERNGYDVSYASGVDVDRAGALLLNHRAYLSVGHDEYWSQAQRANVEAARDAGVHLAFFSGNEVFWKTRWENSIDGSGTPYRTLVSFKETHANAIIDPNPTTWTGTWRDPRFSPPKDGGRPENALTGTMFMVNSGTTGISVPAEDGKMRLWRNTSIASLGVGQVATLPNGTLGYEWDSDIDNGFRPAGLIRMSSTTAVVEVLLDHGSTYGQGPATHSLTLYRHASGAKVFGAGTIQWSWGLDAVHDRAGTPSDSRMQQATVNLFADMNVQPTTLQAGLVPASASTDAIAPTSTITFPANGAALTAGDPITITGTATDTGGGVVGGVEISVDGGATWRRAEGRANWSYTWTPTGSGNVVIRTRSADDSANLEAPGTGITVTVGSAGPTECPCTIWPASATPSLLLDPDTQAVNLGTRFRADEDGVVTAVRFYKGPTNTGTHTGSLWTAGGVLLGSVVFTNESASGWQQATFPAPIAITANTTYVVSYHAPNGRYSTSPGYFLTTGFDRPPLHALSTPVSGGNGVYGYSASPGFPTLTYNSENYWVDVVFEPGSGGSDTTPPTVTSSTPANGATGVSLATAVTVTFSEAMDGATVNTSTIELRNASNILVTASVSYAGNVATLTPASALAGGAVYTATVRGGGSDPRVKDVAGNALAANHLFTFTTISGDTTPPTVTANTPASGAAGVSRTTNVTATFNEPMNAASLSGANVELRDEASNLVAATISYNSSTRVVTLDPTPTLNANTTYTARIRGGAGGATDTPGNPLAADHVWSFATVTDAPPVVTSTTPAPGSTGFVRTANLTATFNEAMTSSSISTSTFQLRDAANNLVAGSVSYSSSTRVATFNPSPTLAWGAVYTATIVGGSSGVTDSGGTVMAANHVWTFTTEIDPPPTITATVPASGATGFSRTGNITVTFNEAMTASTINTTTIELRDSSNALVAGTVSYSSSSRTATFNPSPTLAWGGLYTVTVRGGSSGVKDSNGTALVADHVWSFTTVTDTTPPTITTTSPAAGATNISRTSNITATFSEAMDPATVSTLTFELRTASGAVVPAVVTYDAGAQRATLNPTPTLGGTALHTVVVRGGTADPRVKDTQGNAMLTDRVWTFTTRP